MQIKFMINIVYCCVYICLGGNTNPFRQDGGGYGYNLNKEELSDEESIRRHFQVLKFLLSIVASYSYYDRNYFSYTVVYKTL